MTFTIIVLAIGALIAILWHLNDRFVDRPPPWIAKKRSISGSFRRADDTDDDEPVRPRRLVLPSASPTLDKAVPASTVAAAQKPPSHTVIVKVVTPTAQPIRRPVVEAPDRDAWEDWDADLYGPGQRMRSMAGARLHIHFTDKEGQRTERDVTTIRYSLNPDTGAGVLYAHCHLRNGNRPFALNRISEAVDMQTGEVVKALGPYLDSLYEQTPDFEVERFLDRHGDASYVLFCFAKADGAMRAKEREAILQWAAGQGMESEAVRTEFLATLRNWESSKQAFWRAVRLVKDAGHSPDYIQGVWDTIQRILQSDKAMRGTEADLLRYTAEKWGFKEVDHT